MNIKKIAIERPEILVKSKSLVSQERERINGIIKNCERHGCNV